MSPLTNFSEPQARVMRWLMLLLSVLLVGSLLIPGLNLPANFVPICANSGDLTCQIHRQPGIRLIWGTVVPIALLLIALSHQIWRRICPLSFVSQLGRSLGFQRTVIAKGGRLSVAKVEQKSWLGRHHLQLQWSLFISGLCLRLLVVNGSPFWLAILMIITFLAAMIVGWAFNGKAWCQYICPLGPVETVINGMRGCLGTPAHVGKSSMLTQSTCRTISSDGKELKACVGCQAPCIDIDLERSFWQTLRGKRGLAWAWYSYPGLVFGFFLLMESTLNGAGFENNQLGYLRSGAWAFDAGLPHRAWLPLIDAVPMPRILLIPLSLTLAATASVWLFRGLEWALSDRYQREKDTQHADRAIQHSRLIATFVAINGFFWFVDPLQGALGADGGQLIRSLVLIFMSIWLFRSWRRDQSTYRRESASDSLRRQLHDLPGLELALDGRSLDALSPDEVFTLVKALPAVGIQQGRVFYREVMVEMLRTGRLETASALLELQELRQTLQLEDVDHHAVIRELAEDQPDLLDHDNFQRQTDDLRREAVTEGLEDLLRITGLEVLDLPKLQPNLLERIDRLRLDCGLDDNDWQMMLKRFGPRGEFERERLNQQRNLWIEEAALEASLKQLAVIDPMLRPLKRALTLRLDDRRQLLQPRLLAAGMDALPVQVAAAGDLQATFELLWRDPDPDTAGWVLMLERERYPHQVARRLQDPREGLSNSAFLTSQRLGEADPNRDEYSVLASSSLFADLLPAGLLWVAQHGFMHSFSEGDIVMEKGAESDCLALVIDGDLQLRTLTGNDVVLGTGATVGEMGLIRNEPRAATVIAGPNGARLFILPSHTFEDLLHRSWAFNRGLLAQLAQRLAITEKPSK